jgi:hypothetical protein
MRLAAPVWELARELTEMRYLYKRYGVTLCGEA